MLVTGSISPYYSNNPSFRIVDYDDATFEVSFRFYISPLRVVSRARVRALLQLSRPLGSCFCSHSIHG